MDTLERNRPALVTATILMTVLLLTGCSSTMMPADYQADAVPTPVGDAVLVSGGFSLATGDALGQATFAVVTDTTDARVAQRD